MAARPTSSICVAYPVTFALGALRQQARAGIDGATLEIVRREGREPRLGRVGGVGGGQDEQRGEGKQSGEHGALQARGFVTLESKARARRRTAGRLSKN